MSDFLRKLEQRLGYKFKDPNLLKLALTHRSCGTENNERLEFLGDSILNCIITDALYKQFLRAKEGQLSRLRACLVRGSTLAEIAKELNLGKFVRLGAGELKSGGHQRSSILADLVESVIGAIYLDGGKDECSAHVLRWYESRLKNASVNDKRNKDPKTRLQEWLQSKQYALPRYSLLDTEGQDHNQVFVVECHVEGFETVVGKSCSRRSAEQNAAEKVLIAAQVEDQK